jgi:hypothetical protein
MKLLPKEKKKTKKNRHIYTNQSVSQQLLTISSVYTAPRANIEGLAKSFPFVFLQVLIYFQQVPF